MGCNVNIEATMPLQEPYRTEEGRCVVGWIRNTVMAFRRELCGENVFCREGMAQLQKIAEDISEGSGTGEDIAIMLDICQKITAMADCQVAKIIATNIAQALTLEREQIEAHIKRKRCTSLCCVKLLTYYINPSSCLGCGKCGSICLHSAIKGNEGMIHIIDQEECVKCGDCVDICASASIIKATAGAVLPKLPEEPVPVGSVKRGLGGLRKKLGGSRSMEVTDD